MEKPSLEVVLQALDTLHSNSTSVDPAQKSKADKWLTQLTESVHAWEVADQLLLLNRDMVTSHFAAHTMQNKVRFAFHELPPATHVALRDTLLHHLGTLCKAFSPVVRQVAIALADLALLMGTWTTVVDDLVTRFGHDIATVQVLLDVLIILPEEVNNRHLHLGQNRRRQLTELLSNSSSQVLSVLSACLSSCPGNEDIVTRVFACLGTWAQLRGFTEDMLLGGPVLAAVFTTVKRVDVGERLYEALTDSLCSLLFMCEDVDKYPSLSLELKRHVMELLPVYQAAVASEDLDRAYTLCRVFTELVESLLMYIVQMPGSDLGDLDMLSLLLECVQHPDYEVAEITFNVWFRIGEEVLKLDDTAHTEIFKPYIQRLISSLCVHCQLEEDMAITKVPDENDDHIGFRDNVVELIRDTVFMFGSLSCFAELYANICKPGTAWNVTEACLLIMYAVAPSIRCDESEMLPIAVPVLLSMSPSTHYSVRATTLCLVSQLAGWINEHPDTLDTVLAFIYTSLQIPAVASQAANTVQAVCSKCRGRMGQHFQGLVQIIEVAGQLGIRDQSIIGLLKGITEVLSELDSSAVSQGLLSLVTMISKPLSQVGVDGNVDVCVCVDRVAAVFRACSVKSSDPNVHPAKAAMTHVWPLLANTLNHYQDQVKVVERTCRCVRFMLRCSSLASAELLTDIVSTAITLYQKHQHSCFLYLGSIIVDEFGRSLDYREGLATMLAVFAQTALPLLAGPTGLVEHTDTIDDFFRLCARYLQRCPNVFLQCSVVATVTQCALACCTLGHRDAFSSVMKYFRDLLHLPRDEGLSAEERGACVGSVQVFISEQGHALVDGLVCGFVTLRSFMTVEATDVLWELLECAREHTCVLLGNTLARLPETTRAQVSEQQRTDFIQSVARCGELEELYPVIKRLIRLYH